jgi:hypothetical protein
MPYNVTTNHNNPEEGIMDTYTDYDIDTEGYDPEDYDIDYDEITEMAEDYGYGAYVAERADDYSFDADNPNY